MRLVHAFRKVAISWHNPNMFGSALGFAIAIIQRMIVSLDLESELALKLVTDEVEEEAVEGHDQ